MVMDNEVLGSLCNLLECNYLSALSLRADKLKTCLLWFGHGYTLAFEWVTCLDHMSHTM